MKKASWTLVFALASLERLTLAGTEATEATSNTAELDQLRELETAAEKVIESSKGAFVFIEGGSGFLISEEGYVLTNAHVVDDKITRGLKSFIVQMTGGKSFEASISGY